MLGPLEILVSLGTRRLYGAHRRRIKLTNATALLGMFAAGSWLVAQLVSGSTETAWLNVVGLIAFGIVLLRNATAHTRSSRHILVIYANLHLGVLCTVYYGAVSGAHRWYAAVAVVPFILFTRRERTLCYAYAAVSFLLLALIEFSVIGNQSAVPPMGVWWATRVNTMLVAASLFLIVTLFVRDITNAEAEIERLLLNILPRTIAERLRADEHHIADAIDEASILFADLVGFTPLAARLSPREVVQVLDEVFSAFDHVADELQLEKIKTIGDAYMVAAGVPTPRKDHAEAIVSMALRMREIVAEVGERTGYDLQIRIGINTGPVVAGVIGTRKFAYDMWGDTVNTASRLESHGVPGEIHLSRSTRDCLGEGYTVEARGEIEVKGKGKLETFFLRPER